VRAEGKQFGKWLLVVGAMAACSCRGDIRPVDVQARAHSSQGFACYQRGDFDGAIAEFTAVLRLMPGSAETYFARGVAYADRGDLERAIADFGESIRLDPGQTAAHQNRASAYMTRKEYGRAIDDYSALLRRTGEPDLYYRRGVARSLNGQYAPAAEDYAAAVKLDPKSLYACNALAWLRATCPDAGLRDGGRALVHAKEACALTEWKNPYCLGTLAAACAEAGDFKRAVEWQKKALEFGSAYGPEESVRGRERLRLYESGRPYREAPARP